MGAEVAKGVGWGVTNHQARPVPLASTNANAAQDVAKVKHGIALSSAIGHAGTSWAGEQGQGSQGQPSFQRSQGQSSFTGSSAALSHSSSVEGSVQEASDAPGSTGARHRSVSLSVFFVSPQGFHPCGMRGGFIVLREREHYTESPTTNLC